jgi:hypothetical protein
VIRSAWSLSSARTVFPSLPWSEMTLSWFLRWHTICYCCNEFKSKLWFLTSVWQSSMVLVSQPSLSNRRKYMNTNTFMFSWRWLWRIPYSGMWRRIDRVNLHFGGTYRLHLQGKKIRERGISTSMVLQTEPAYSRIIHNLDITLLVASNRDKWRLH